MEGQRAVSSWVRRSPFVWPRGGRARSGVGGKQLSLDQM